MKIHPQLRKSTVTTIPSYENPSPVTKISICENPQLQRSPVTKIPSYENYVGRLTVENSVMICFPQKEFLFKMLSTPYHRTAP